MAYSGTKIETWNRSTPRDGLLLDSEFSQLYDDIENYISGNSGAEPPYTLKELADGTVTFAGAKTFSSKITGSISGDCDGNAGTVTGGVYTSGDQTIAGVKTFSDGVDGIKDQGSTGAVIHKKIIEIGDWNMYATESKTVNHGLTFSKIRGFSVLIRDDSDTVLSYLWSAPLVGSSPPSPDYSNLHGGAVVNTTAVSMARPVADCPYNSTEYDSTSYNRGWIIIEYVD
jgi:hypothetical protein